MKLDMNREYYVMYVRAFNRETRKYDGEEYVGEAYPVYDYEGNKLTEPKPWFGDEVPYRVEVVKFEALPSEGLRFAFERNPAALLERLPIDSVLACGKLELPVNCSDAERAYVEKQMVHSGEELYQKVGKYVRSIVQKQNDAPAMQVMPSPVVVRGKFTAAPSGPSTTERLDVCFLPSNPFGDESAGSTESMCQTPL